MVLIDIVGGMQIDLGIGKLLENLFVVFNKFILLKEEMLFGVLEKYVFIVFEG